MPAPADALLADEGLGSLLLDREGMLLLLTFSCLSTGHVVKGALLDVLSFILPVVDFLKQSRFECRPLSLQGPELRLEVLGVFLLC